MGLRLATMMIATSLVPRPLIQHVYRLQYNARILKAIGAGVGLGLGPRLDSYILYSFAHFGCCSLIAPASLEILMY